MGAERKLRARIGRAVHEVRALRETDEIVLRGADVRRVVRFAAVRACSVRGGWLTLTDDVGSVALDLGDDAARWAEAIARPKSVLEKIGVRADHVVGVVGRVPELAELVAELPDTARPSPPRRVSGGAKRVHDLVFFGAAAASELAKVEALVPSVGDAGALWIVYPKGVEAIRERDVLTAGRGAGLKDVKVVRWSETHTALKFVVPVEARGKKR